MVYRILWGNDLHKRMKDITTITGYTVANYAVQCDLMQAIRQKEINMFFSGGDWFDKGYGSDVAAALAHTDIDREMAKLLKGNFYGLIGNHIKIRMDSNPELFLIQPHPVYTSRHEVARTEQIIKTPKELILNGVQICFMHWNPYAESAIDYKPMINKDCHYHIALFHTPKVIPANFLQGMNIIDSVSDNSQISRCLEDVELAIVGDIHKPLGAFDIHRLDGGTTTMIVPGSLTNTDAGLGSRHDYVDLPLIEIDDNGRVTLEYYRQTLHTELLTFHKKEISTDTREKLRSIHGNTKETLYNELEATTFVGESNSFITLNSFMKNMNYTQGDKSMIKTVINNPYDISSLISMYNADKQAIPTDI